MASSQTSARRAAAEPPVQGAPPGRRRRASFAERREQRAAVDDPEVVLAAAARFLEARSRSVGEVRRRLSQAGYRSELVEGAIARLVGLGMLDDATFAAEWVASRDRARPRGESALRRELMLRGVDRDTIEQALEARRRGERPLHLGEALQIGAEPGGDDAPLDGNGREDQMPPDEAAAWRLLERRAASLRREADPQKRRQRAYALLARNGFDPGTCAEVAATWTDREGADPDVDLAPGADEDPEAPPSEH